MTIDQARAAKELFCIAKPIRTPGCTSWRVELTAANIPLVATTPGGLVKALEEEMGITGVSYSPPYGHSQYGNIVYLCGWVCEVRLYDKNRWVRFVEMLIDAESENS